MTLDFWLVYCYHINFDLLKKMLAELKKDYSFLTPSDLIDFPNYDVDAY
eukprot:CAMPEP_0116898562 /NCGR_PEP_ID=MMETSP0467-20121206/7272_1 /TAXON_ID=283647 /ORGANISM="Mesodinium pulex, Strain SPMC105" /LENGTH=48 /DNA_ID= /DNA_START= /DNA_END= /DNA_ORIENTATION=